MSVEGRTFSRAGIVGVLAGAVWLLLMAWHNPQRSALHGDGYYTYLWARTIVFDRDVDFANDYVTCTDPWGMASMPHGLAMNQWSPGAALFFAPVLAYDLVTHHPALDNADPRVANGCIGALPERAVVGSVFAGLLVLWLAFLAARRVAGDGIAAAGATGAVLAGPVVFYATVLLSYGHAASAALGGLAVWSWMRERHRPETERSEGRRSTRWGWISMGLTLGLAMLARPQNAILVVLPLWHWIEGALAAARVAPTDGGRGLSPAARRALGVQVLWGLAFTAAMLAAFGLQLYQWWSSTGELFLVPQGDYYLRPESPRIANLLFSSANGLFTWCPIAYVAVAGLVALALRERTRGIGVPLLVVLVVTTWVNSCVADWWGAVGFAARRYDAMTVPFAIGIAAALAELVSFLRARPRAAPAVITTSLVLSLVAMTSSSSMAIAAGLRSDIAQPAPDTWGRASHYGQRVLWGVAGNPLAWPASIPFAIRHGVSPRVWDQASMPELFFHRWLTLETQGDLVTADLVGAHDTLAIGFDAVTTTPRGAFRFPTADGARVLLPISYPYVGGLTLQIEPVPDAPDQPMHVWLALDDEVLGTFLVRRGQTSLEVPVAAPHQGIVELRMRLAEGTMGLARVEIRDRTPHPRIAQARRNARLRARRVAWRIEHGLAEPGTE